MKKLLIITTAFFFIACNNSGTQPGGEPVNNTSQLIDKPEGNKTNEPPVTAEASACGRMVSFQPGAEIEAITYDGSGKEKSKQYTKVLSVNIVDGFTVANAEGKTTNSKENKEDKAVNFSYKCDGNKIYMDIASMFRTAEKQQDATFESSFIEYPINVKEGDILPDATGMMSSVKNGKKMTMKFVYKNRKVEGKEAITTAAGSWNCFKISNTVESEMDIPGMDEKTIEMMKKMSESMKMSTTTWFAPDFGIVKMEMYMNGKLQSRNEITSVKQ